MTRVPVLLKNVTKRFGKKGEEILAVDRFSHDFEAGKLTTLLGPSGCGKTTTLRCIAGFYEPEEGDIVVGGKRVNHLPPYQRPTGTVFQNYALFPHMTVFENVAYGLKIKKLPAAEIKKKVAAGLELLQLGGMEDRMPDQLSGGQQQRVAIARVLVNEPQVLLFDEPLSNLDAKLRLYMRGEIRNLQERLGITTIYVTHDQEEATSISDTMLVMNQGRIEQVGSPIEIYRRPATKFVAEFIGITNYLHGTVQKMTGNRVQISLYEAVFEVEVDDRFEEGEEVTIVARPEMLRFAEEGEAALRGKIKNAFFLGSLARYEIEVANGHLISLDDANPTHFRARGTNVAVALDTLTVYVKKTDV
ncbi:MAG: ABC transporter ATP-binding protein [Deltaproteobacteria bacterium]|nr:ABC transporter ATP-binding protein [Deltaproteobacteria bacterium]MBW2071531.1 ABC transporter ATP-binding protein [Deltaproteobacteria bacterium]